MFTIILSLICLALDQITKYFAVSSLQGNNSVLLIKNVFELTYVENTGAAFGIFKNGNLFFIISTIIILLVIVSYLIIKKPKEKIITIPSALIIGGALGNIIDRIFRGYVVDFLNFSLIDFPVFNVADCFVVIGAIIFMYYIIFIDGKKEKEEKDEQ